MLKKANKGILITLGLILFLTCGGPAYAEWKVKGDLDIYMFPVTYGDAILIELPNGNLWLIDGGKIADEDGPIIGKFLMNKCAVNGKVTIDTWLITHFDTDHYCGVMETIGSEEIHVNRIFHGGVGRLAGSKLGPFDPTLDELMDINLPADPVSGNDFAREFGKFISCAQSEDLEMFAKLDASDYHELTDMVTDGNPDGLDIDVTLYNPPAEYRNYSGTQKTTNGNSIVILLSVGDYDVLLAGDINKKAEKYLLNEAGFPLDDIKGVDLFKFPHHGSADHLDKFISGLMPVEVWFSPGTKDDRFPNAKWKDFLKDIHAKALYTKTGKGLYKEITFTD